MMGNKKLSTIREELKAVLTANGEEPIRWLEKRIAAAKRKGEGTTVLEAVKRVLERGTPKKPRKSAAKRKKTSST